MKNTIIPLLPDNPDTS